MMQCADPHFCSQWSAPAGIVYAYSLNKANIFPFPLSPAEGIGNNINVVKLSYSKRSILTVIYGLAFFLSYYVLFLVRI